MDDAREWLISGKTESRDPQSLLPSLPSQHRQLRTNIFQVLKPYRTQNISNKKDTGIVVRIHCLTICGPTLSNGKNSLEVIEQSSFKLVSMYFEVFNLMSRSVANAHNSCYLLNPHRGVPRPACQWTEVPLQSSLCATAWSRDFLDDCVAMEAPHPRRLDLVWWSIHRPGSICYFSPVSLLSSWKGEELSLQDYVDLSPLNFP